MARRGRPKGSKSKTVNITSLIKVDEPKIRIPAKRLTLTDAKKFHSCLGRVYCSRQSETNGG